MTSHQTIAETKSSSSLELLMVVSTTETSKSRRTQEHLKRQTIISSVSFLTTILTLVSNEIDPL